MKEIILASKSPRRFELMSKANINFTVITKETVEKLNDSLPIEEAIMDLAYQKAHAVATDYPQSYVLGSDTLVVYNNQVLGKPKNEDDAYNTLKILSGKTHQVITGVAIIHGSDIHSFYGKTYVTFKELTDEDIINYIKTNEPMDKAGSYGIQGLGGLFVDNIKGDYNNVVGLPIDLVVDKLRELKVI